MNLLENAEFDSTVVREFMRVEDGERTFVTPMQWEAGLLTGLTQMRWMNRVPNSGAHTGARRVSGTRSFHIHCEDGTFTAWLYQRVRVVPGTAVTAGAQAFLEGVDGACARVGLDPVGGENPFARTVLWSPWARALDRWSPRAVSSSAQGEFATIFLYGTQMSYADPNGVYWDAAYLNGTRGDESIPIVLGFRLDYHLRFREEASTNAVELSKIARGTVVMADGRTVDNLWIRARLGPLCGWLPAQFGTLEGVITRLPVVG
jgi:hypothetical protein